MNRPTPPLLTSIDEVVSEKLVPRSAPDGELVEIEGGGGELVAGDGTPEVQVLHPTAWIRVLTGGEEGRRRGGGGEEEEAEEERRELAGWGDLGGRKGDREFYALRW